MKFKIIMLIVAVFAGLIAATQAANAVAGCSGDVRTQMSERTMDTYFVEPITGDRVPLRFTARPGYWNCPNGDQSNKMKGKWAELCWSQTGDNDNHRLFDGATFNLRLTNDNGIFTNPGPYKVEDDGSRQNCGRQNFGDDIEEWTYFFNHPKWAGSVTVNLTAMNDQRHDFGELSAGDGGTFKEFKPASDDIVKDWWR